jgi:hypothetical protein
MKRTHRRWRTWLLVLGCSVAVPQAFLGCREMSLDFQRSLIQAIGFQVGDALVNL